MRCSNCGSANSPTLRFCEQCGTPLLGAALAAPVVCPRCGAGNPAGLRFCEQCGTPLLGVAPAAPAVCPNCGAGNPAGLRFCEQCGAPLAVAVSAAARRSRRRFPLWLVAIAIILPALFLAWRLLLSGPSVAPGTTDQPVRVSQEDALHRVTEIVAKEYPQFAGSTPDMEEIELGPDKGYRLVYRSSEVTETGAGPVEFKRTLVVAINAVSGEMSVAVSQ